MHERARRGRERSDSEWRWWSGHYGTSARVLGSRVGSERVFEFELAGLLWPTVGELRDLYGGCGRYSHGAGRLHRPESGDGEEEARRSGGVELGVGLMGSRLGVRAGDWHSGCKGLGWVNLMEHNKLSYSAL